MGEPMREIPYTRDIEDRAGHRCDATNGDHKCHRHVDHSKNTTTILKKDDDTSEIVEFNHRTLADGRYFTW